MYNKWKFSAVDAFKNYSTPLNFWSSILPYLLISGRFQHANYTSKVKQQQTYRSSFSPKISDLICLPFSASAYTSNHMKTYPQHHYLRLQGEFQRNSDNGLMMGLLSGFVDGSPAQVRSRACQDQYLALKKQWSVFKSCCLNMNSMLFTHKYRFCWPHNIQIEIPPKGAPEPAVNIELVLHLSLDNNEAPRFFVGSTSAKRLMMPCKSAMRVFQSITSMTELASWSRQPDHIAIPQGLKMI